MGENGDDGDLATIGIKWNDISCGKDFHVEALKAEIDPDLGGNSGLEKKSALSREWEKGCENFVNTEKNSRGSQIICWKRGDRKYNVK